MGGQTRCLIYWCGQWQPMTFLKCSMHGPLRGSVAYALLRDVHRTSWFHSMSGSFTFFSIHSPLRMTLGWTLTQKKHRISGERDVNTFVYKASSNLNWVWAFLLKQQR